MDLATLKLLLETLGVGLALGKVSTELPKIMTDFGLNRLTQKKHRAELIETLTRRPEVGKPETHSMAVQAQFHAAFGGEASLIPSGDDILHFLSNPALATLKTARDLAASLPLVTYSKLANGFMPAGKWTARKLNREYLYQFVAYWVGALVTLICFSNSNLAPSLGWFAALGIAYAISKAYRAGQINRARRLLASISNSAH